MQNMLNRFVECGCNCDSDKLI